MERSNDADSAESTQRKHDETVELSEEILDNLGRLRRQLAESRKSDLERSSASGTGTE